MTVKEFADSRGVSKQLVYQLVKAAGKQISDLTDKGNIKESELEFLESIVPDKKKNDAEPAGTDTHKTKESEVDRLKAENRILLESVNSLTATVNGLREDLKTAHKLADQAQQLNAVDKKRIAELEKQLRLESGSEPDESINQEEKTEPETVKADEPEKKDPEGESPEPVKPEQVKKEDPKPDEQAKGEGETVSGAAGSDQTKPEQSKKPTLKERLRYLFTGEK